MKKILITILGVILANQAQAEFISGNQLLRDMSEDNYYSKGYATGYVIGVQDALDGIYICAPSQVTVKQLVDITRNYLTEHPENRHLTGNVLVMRALSEKFPCRKN